MGLDEKILARFDELIVMGGRVIATQIPGPADGFRLSDLDLEVARQWWTSCLNLIRRVYGADSDHYLQFSGLERINFANTARQARGILKSAKDDYEQGMLFDARALITAEVFTEILEQAEYLLEAHVYQPAAVIAGAVLEDGLRKLCVRHNIALPDKAKVETMNAELKRADVYNGLVQKQITALADLRNKAAHGQWDQFTEAQVTTMLPQVRDFMTLHFS